MAAAKPYVLPLASTDGSLAALLPWVFLAQLQLGVGDKLYLTEQPDGGLLISAQMPDREAQLREARDILDKRRNVLRPLAD